MYESCHSSSPGHGSLIDYVAAYLNSHTQAITYIELPDGAKVEGKVGRLIKHFMGRWMVPTTGQKH